jgi:murein L,D-transpeptidase YafK
MFKSLVPFFILLISLSLANADTHEVPQVLFAPVENSFEEQDLDSQIDRGTQCAGQVNNLLDKIQELTEQVSEIVDKYGENNKWPNREDPNKIKVVNLQEEVLCLELMVFSQENNLDLKINCQSIPKKMPPMHLRLVKNSNSESLLEYATKALNKRKNYLREGIAKEERLLKLGDYNKIENYIQNAQNIISRKKAEADCLDKYPDIESCPDSSVLDGNMPQRNIRKILNTNYAEAPLLTIMVQHNGQLLPFKTMDKVEDNLIVRSGLGPKLVEGDEITPEGVFNLNSATTSTNYFTASKIDYENWNNRSELLSGLPQGQVNPQKKGGDVLIHGAGGSIGCLSLNNSKAAYITALVRNKNQTREPIKISIYPGEMTTEFMQNIDQLDPQTKSFTNFWMKLKKSYDSEEGLVNSDVVTINKILTN